MVPRLRSHKVPVDLEEACPAIIPRRTTRSAATATTTVRQPLTPVENKNGANAANNGKGKGNNKHEEAGQQKCQAGQLNIDHQQQQQQEKKGRGRRRPRKIKQEQEPSFIDDETPLRSKSKATTRVKDRSPTKENLRAMASLPDFECIQAKNKNNTENHGKDNGAETTPPSTTNAFVASTDSPSQTSYLYSPQSQHVLDLATQFKADFAQLATLKHSVKAATTTLNLVPTTAGLQEKPGDKDAKEDLLLSELVDQIVGLELETRDTLASLASAMLVQIPEPSPAEADPNLLTLRDFENTPVLDFLTADASVSMDLGMDMGVGQTLEPDSTAMIFDDIDRFLLQHQQAGMELEAEWLTEVLNSEEMARNDRPQI